ncbi:MAG: hypothetical protein AAGG07_01315 [Planctomycetota bacterium]
MSTDPNARKGLWRRLRYTPAGDLSTRRLTARLDPETLYADLANDDIETIRRIVFRARVRRTERAEIATDLAQRFRDAKDDPEATNTLNAELANHGAAARRLGKAKRRARPIHRKLSGLTLRASGVILGLLFAGLFPIWLYYGQFYRQLGADPHRDRLEEYNATIRDVPEEDNAWPLYEKAMISYNEIYSDAFDARPAEQQNWEHSQMLSRVEGSAQPGDPGWRLAVAHAERLRPALDLLHAAAQRPRFARITPVDNREPIVISGDLDVSDASSEAEALPLQNASIGHLGEFRHMVSDAAIDIRVAAVHGDSERILQHVVTWHAIATHLECEPFTLSKLYGLVIADLARNALLRTLADDPGLLADDQIDQLARAVRDYRPTLDSSYERDVFLEALDRYFTRSGYANGSAVAFVKMQDLSKTPMNRTIHVLKALPDSLVAPLAIAIVAPADEQIERFDRIVAYYRQQGELPPHARAPLPEQLRVDVDPWVVRHYRPVEMLEPADGRLIDSKELHELQRRAALLVLALELHRRERGSLPTTLADIRQPTWSEYPIDPMDGAVARYRLATPNDPAYIQHAGYVLYTLGPDGIDDGGTPHRNGDYLDPIPDWYTPHEDRRRPELGDHILFPPPPSTLDYEAAYFLGLVPLPYAPAD